MTERIYPAYHYTKKFLQRLYRETMTATTAILNVTQPKTGMGSSTSLRATGRGTTAIKFSTELSSRGS